MLFNSIDFVIFLPIVFLIYWFVVNKSYKFQNFFIVLASYFFYGWWDYRFLALIVFSTLIDFSVGKLLYMQTRELNRKLLLWISITANLGFLGFFKYYNFFLDSFVSTFSFLGYEINPQGLNIILPVGISFYTFQTLSYTIDVYRKRLVPTNDLIAFSAFVSFFPQLVAGPIERAVNLLPQFYSSRTFDYKKAVDGLRQILWGLFKKVVIADSCAEYANLIFNNSADYSGSTLLLGAVFFAFQIYGDFSGYSDIAIGTSRLFGFDMMKNFANPYFSRDIAEFWRRWHISLSSWFRDYLYIPLGGSRGSELKKVRNIFIIFVVSGFWHGADWTFIIWGLLNAIYFLPQLLAKTNRRFLDSIAKNRILPSPKELLQVATTFMLTTFAWIFFRAENIEHAFDIIVGIFQPALFRIPVILPVYLFLLLALMLVVEWIQREKQHGLYFNGSKTNRLFRWSTYCVFTILVLAFFGGEATFIYFQF